MNYIVIEIQKNDSVATLINNYDNRNAAYSKYYQILAAAAISQVPLHAAAILTEEGYTIENKSFYHNEDE